MSAHTVDSSSLTETDVRLSATTSKGMGIAAAAGVVGLIAAFALGGAQGDKWKSFLLAYHTAYIYFISLSLGALFFVIIQHLVKAGWSVVVRRLAEIIAANIPLMALLFLPTAIFAFQAPYDLFIWLDLEKQKTDHLIHAKHAYLNQGFFIVRLLIYFGAWSALSWFFLSTSLKQDQSGDPKLTLLMKNVSAPAILVFGLTITFFAFDMLMSLNPHWFSTIFGVCFFAGSAMGFFALLALFARRVQKGGQLKNVVTPEHYHDIGKLLFAFVFFWGYVNFSQFMLIWYANIPEETIYYQHRAVGGWFAIGMLLLFGHFLIPFVGLLSRYAKRIPQILCFWGVWLLIAHYFDILYLVKPNFEMNGERYVSLGLLDIACLLGIGGLYVANLLRMAAKHPLVPVKDPRLDESLAFHNI
ncbi:MAG TPA: quinol:cytochrome C oxidoreductase [Planctomycetota bacterium]|nr:quinol:cytochrome C oxidoreductase [Planctomycetota bacterium]